MKYVGFGYVNCSVIGGDMWLDYCEMFCVSLVSMNLNIM